MNTLLYGADLATEVFPTIQNCPECGGDGEIFYWADTGERIPPKEYMEKYFNKWTEREIIIEACTHCSGKGYVEIWEEEADDDRFNEERYYESKYNS